MKTIKLGFAALLSLCLMTSVVRANDAGITYTGDANEFIKTTDEISVFKDIMPGEQRTQTIRLTNENYDSMKFFVKVDDTSLLDKGTKGNIVYDIAFENDGTTFYSGRVGGMSKANKDNLGENYLLKTLKKGESTQISMSIKVDGTSMTDDYQGSLGNLGIVFSVEHSDNDKVVEIIKKIPVINKIPGVNTGDKTSVYSIVAIAGISLIILCIVLLKRRKDEKHEVE